jgi:hypothetical protein
MGTTEKTKADEQAKTTTESEDQWSISPPFSEKERKR